MQSFTLLTCMLIIANGQTIDNCTSIGQLEIYYENASDLSDWTLGGIADVNDGSWIGIGTHGNKCAAAECFYLDDYNTYDTDPQSLCCVNDYPHAISSEISTIGYSNINLIYSVYLYGGTDACDSSKCAVDPDCCGAECFASYSIGSGFVIIHNTTTSGVRQFIQQPLPSDANNVNNLQIKIEANGPHVDSITTCYFDEIRVCGTLVTNASKPSWASTKAKCLSQDIGFINTTYRIQHKTETCIDGAIGVISRLMKVIDIIYSTKNIFVHSNITESEKDKINNINNKSVCNNFTIHIYTCFNNDTHDNDILNVTISRQFMEDINDELGKNITTVYIEKATIIYINNVYNNNEYTNDNMIIWIIICSSVAAFVIIVIIAALLYCNYKKNQQQSKKMDNKLTEIANRINKKK